MKKSAILILLAVLMLGLTACQTLEEAVTSAVFKTAEPTATPEPTGTPEPTQAPTPVPADEAQSARLTAGPEENGEVPYRVEGVNASGAVVWKTELEWYPVDSPVLPEELGASMGHYYWIGSGVLHCLDMLTGYELWYKGGLRGMGHTAYFGQEGEVYLGTREGGLDFIAYDRDGNELIHYEDLSEGAYRCVNRIWREDGYVCVGYAEAADPAAEKPYVVYVNEDSLFAFMTKDAEAEAEAEASEGD